jgi:hypothetical protein
MPRFPVNPSPTPSQAPVTTRLLGQSTSPQSMSGSPQAGALVQSLLQRVEALEAALRDLAASAVQQHPDGRLQLPAGHQLRIETGNTRLTMDVTRFTVEANGRVVVETPPVSQAPAAPAPSGQSLAQSPTSWQSIAQQNMTADPRRA